MDFTPTQQQTLLSKMGYDGPANPKMMEAFLASNPGAAAKMGKFNRALQKKSPVKGLAKGGPITAGTRSTEHADISGYYYNGRFFDSYANAVAARQKDLDAQAAASQPETTTTTTDTTARTGSTTDPSLNDLYKSTALELYNTLRADEPTSAAGIISSISGASTGSFDPEELKGKDVAGLEQFLRDTGTYYVEDDQIKKYQSGLDPLIMSPDIVEQLAGRTGDNPDLQTSPDVSAPQGVTVDLATAKQALSDATSSLAQASRNLESNPESGEFQIALEKAQKAYQEAQSNLNLAQTQFGTTGIPTPGEAVASAITTPEDLTTEATVDTIGEATTSQLIGAGTGQATDQTEATTTTAASAAQAAAPGSQTASTYDAAQTSGDIKTALKGGEREYKWVDPADAGFKPPPPGSLVTMAMETFYNPTTGEKVFVNSGGYTAPEGWIKGQPEGLFKEEGVSAAQGDVTKVITAATFNATDLAQLGLSAPQIEQIREVVDTGDLELTQGQLVEAATLANQGIPLPQSIAQATGLPQDVVAAKFEGETPQAEAVVDYNVPPTQAATLLDTEIKDAAQAKEIPVAEDQRSEYESLIEAAKGTVGANELVDAEAIKNVAETIEVTAQVMDSLNESAKAQAAQGTFSQAALAVAEQGTVPAAGTIAGQMEKLMAQFDNGTPAWAAGAMRAANAALAARGLGASSMAGAAIVQASMESAMPIAQQDAAAFLQMELTNLDNRQQVALANAAAQQGMELANLNNRQQVALQNSANAFALQSQSLSNMQATVVANAQFKASLRGQILDVYTQAGIANASRYAELNNINLNNEQQTIITRSAQNLQVDLSNLDTAQQTALANLQVRASLRGQELTNEQQMAMLESTQNFQRAEFNANAQQQAFMQDAAAQLAMQGKVMDNRQQTALFNISNQIQEREIELTNEQQTRLFNQTNRINVDLANLSNRQQTALANAQIEAALRGQELTNAQQTGVVNAARISEIANINFTADQQRAIQNSKLAQTVDVENLNARSAKLLADASAMAQTDLTNLNNRQQAQVQNAQNFLQMDLANLDNEQQTDMFTSQAIINSMLSDQAAENAALQFNAASENQVNQFFENLAANVSQFNAAQTNAINQFNAGETNATERFNAQLEAARDQFNASNSLIIAQANAKWNQTISTIDTAEQNEANRNAALTANSMTLTALNELFQKERDLMDYAFTANESAASRALSLLMADKEEDFARWQTEQKEDAAKGYLGLKIASDILFTPQKEGTTTLFDRALNWIF